MILFDESLNKILQQEQMDMIVRFWDKTTHRVIFRQFLGHTRATDLLKNFKIGLIGLHSANLLQVSMDGPATNWKFYDNLLEDRKQEDPNIPSLLNVGSCGLQCCAWWVSDWSYCYWMEIGESFKINVVLVC